MASSSSYLSRKRSAASSLSSTKRGKAKRPKAERDLRSVSRSGSSSTSSSTESDLTASSVIRSVPTDSEELSDDDMPDLSPDDIYFSQPDVRAKFTNAPMDIFQTLFTVREGLVSLNDIPPIRVMRHQGRYYSLDNSRLWLMKKLHRVRYDYIPGSITEELRNKLATRGRRNKRGLVPVREVPCSKCNTLSQRTDRFGEEEFAHHVVDAHAQMVNKDDGLPLTLLDLRARSGTSPAGRFCRLCRRQVSSQATNCSLAQKCKLGSCSNKYPCQKSRLRLNCDHGMSVVGNDMRFSNLIQVYKMHIKLEKNCKREALKMTR